MKSERFTAMDAVTVGLLEAVESGETKIECKVKLERGDLKFEQRNFCFTDKKGKMREGKRLTAKSVSGEFKNTEEIIKFGREMEKAGATIEFDEEEMSSGVEKYTAKEAIEKKSIFYVRYSKTKVEFIEKCLDDLWFFDQVKKMYTRQGYALKNKDNMSERVLERNRNFWANPERYCQEDRSKFFDGRIFNFGKLR